MRHLCRRADWLCIRPGCAVPSILCFAAVFFFLPSVHATESYDGHRFLYNCLTTESDYDGDRRFAECERFVREVRDVLGYHTIHGQQACIPPSVPDIQLVVAGIAGIKARRNQHSEEAHALLAEIFSNRWPCTE